MKSVWGDANLDGAFTISDIWIYAKFIGCFPGNFIMRQLGNTGFGRFFEISPTDGYTTGAWIVSALVWWIAILAASGSAHSAQK